MMYVHFDSVIRQEKLPFLLFVFKIFAEIPAAIESMYKTNV